MDWKVPYLKLMLCVQSNAIGLLLRTVQRDCAGSGCKSALNLKTCRGFDNVLTENSYVLKRPFATLWSVHSWVGLLTSMVGSPGGVIARDGWSNPQGQEHTRDITCPTKALCCQLLSAAPARVFAVMQRSLRVLHRVTFPRASLAQQACPPSCLPLRVPPDSRCRHTAAVILTHKRLLADLSILQVFLPGSAFSTAKVALNPCFLLDLDNSGL